MAGTVSVLGLAAFRAPSTVPKGVTEAYEAAGGSRAGYEMHVFEGGHALGAEESRAVIDWWLPR